MKPSNSQVLVALMDILRISLLRIRMLGWNGKPDRCAIEADHVHNIPELVSRFSPSLLGFYWETERPAYIAQSTADEIQPFKDAWSVLQLYLVCEHEDGLGSRLAPNTRAREERAILAPCPRFRGLALLSPVGPFQDPGLLEEQPRSISVSRDRSALCRGKGEARRRARGGRAECRPVP